MEKRLYQSFEYDCTFLICDKMCFSSMTMGILSILHVQNLVLNVRTKSKNCEWKRKNSQKSMVDPTVDWRSMMLGPVHHYWAASGHISNHDEHSHEETWTIWWIATMLVGGRKPHAYAWNPRILLCSKILELKFRTFRCWWATHGHDVKKKKLDATHWSTGT